MWVEPLVIFLKNFLSEFSDSLDFVLQRIVKLERADCDFTDRVWSVVRGKRVGGKLKKKKNNFKNSLKNSFI